MFVTRHQVAETLRMTERSTLDPKVGLRPRRMNLLDTQDMVDLLNRSARAGMPLVQSVAMGSVITADELEIALGIPAHRLLLATRWKHRAALPHWRINKQVTRFNLDAAKKWMAAR